MQPFVLQYGRLELVARRRSRRIATERPATDGVVVRKVMVPVQSFWSRVSRAQWMRSARLRDRFLRLNDRESVIGADLFEFRGERRERVGLDRRFASADH